jgi:hypothetical protein
MQDLVRYLTGWLLPKKPNMAEAAHNANFVYYDAQSTHPEYVLMAEKVIIKPLDTKTTLHMVHYQDKESPVYQTIVVRGTVGSNDHWYDNLQHAVRGEGMTDYQHDAYQVLKHHYRYHGLLPIVLTGHSMGGKIIDLLLAQIYVDCQSSEEETKQTALGMFSLITAIYVFDSPGTYPLIEAYFKMAFEERSQDHFERFLKLRETKVIEIVGHPNSVNMCHRHAGAVYFLPSYGQLQADRLETLLSQDYTDKLLAKHSIADIAKAVSMDKPLVMVSRWGGVSPLEHASTLRKLGNFVHSYSEHTMTQSRLEPTWGNRVTAVGMSLFSNALDQSKITSKHPLMRAARNADRAYAASQNQWRLLRMCHRVMGSFSSMIPSGLAQSSESVIAPTPPTHDVKSCGKRSENIHPGSSA